MTSYVDLECVNLEPSRVVEDPSGPYSLFVLREVNAFTSSQRYGCNLNLFFEFLFCRMKVPAGNQAALSAQTMELPCKLDGLELTSHFKDLFHDVTKREMMLHSVVTISGESLVWKWRHPFQVRNHQRIVIVIVILLYYSLPLECLTF